MPQRVAERTNAPSSSREHEWCLRQLPGVGAVGAQRTRAPHDPVWLCPLGRVRRARPACGGYSGSAAESAAALAPVPAPHEAFGLLPRIKERLDPNDGRDASAITKPAEAFRQIEGGHHD